MEEGIFLKSFAGLVALAVIFGTGNGKAFCEDKDYVVARIGDENILFSEIEKLAGNLDWHYKENFDKSKDWRLDFVKKYLAKLALAKRAAREGLAGDAAYGTEGERQGELADRLKKRRLSKIKLTEDDIRKYYGENKERYQIREKIKISYIKPQDRKRAEEIVAKLNKGESFRQAAGAEIVEVDNWISKDAPFVPDLQEVLSHDVLEEIFELGVGANSGIVESKDEFYIFNVDEKEPAKDRPFSEVAEQVRFACSKKMMDEAMEDLIEETFSGEGVVIYEDKIIENMPVK